MSWLSDTHDYEAVDLRYALHRAMKDVAYYGKPPPWLPDANCSKRPELIEAKQRAAAIRKKLTALKRERGIKKPGYYW